MKNKLKDIGCYLLGISVCFSLLIILSFIQKKEFEELSKMRISHRNEIILDNCINIGTDIYKIVERNEV